jgi:uncharacterized protein involved in oxidation of intracellular sulfur
MTTRTRVVGVLLVLMVSVGAVWAAPGKGKRMKIGIVISQTDAETVFNALRYANFALKQKDTVGIFLLGRGVELDRIRDRKFDVEGQAKTFLEGGGKIQACGTCLKLRDSEGSELCPLSTMQDLDDLVRDSDKVLTF